MLPASICTCSAARSRLLLLLPPSRPQAGFHTLRLQHRQCEEQQQQQQRARRGAVVAAARPSTRPLQPTSSEEGPLVQAIEFTSWLVSTPIYTALEVTVLLAMLAVLDAGYSGDWSRIGVISQETELLLQKVAVVVWGLHGVCAVAAASIAKGKGRNLGTATTRGLMFGTLGVMREVVADPEEPEPAAVSTAPKRPSSKAAPPPKRR